MAQPGRMVLELWAGSIFSDTWTWYTDDDETAPKNLTNYTALLHCRRKKSDTLPLFAVGSVAGSIVLGGAAGTIVVTIADSVTEGLVVPDGWWGLEMTNTAPNPDTIQLLIEGKLIIHPEVVY